MGPWCQLMEVTSKKHVFFTILQKQVFAISCQTKLIKTYFGAKIVFLHDRLWISPWIKSISNELDITCHVFASQLSGHCDVIANRLWHHQQNVKRARHGDDMRRSSFLESFMDSLCRVRNKIMYVLLWQTVYALTRVLFWCLFLSLLCKSGNKHQNNPLVSA